MLERRPFLGTVGLALLAVPLLGRADQVIGG